MKPRKPRDKLDFSSLFLYTSSMVKGSSFLSFKFIIIFIALPVVIAAFTISCSSGRTADLLTPGEKEWLAAHTGQIRLGTESRLDLYGNEGVYNGIAADYIKLIQEKLDVKFQIVRIESWEDEIKKITNRDVDVANNLTGTSRLSQYMLFTRPYLEFPAVFVTRKKDRFNSRSNTPAPPLTPASIKHHTIVITPNDSLKSFLYSQYPGVTVKTVPDPVTGLKMVSSGKADSIIMNRVTANYYFRETRISNLAIAGPTGYIYKAAIASRSDWPILNRILNKALQMITQSERRDILGRWTHKKYFWQKKEFWTAFLVITGIAFLLVILTLTWNATLRKKVKHQTRKIQTELTAKIKAQKDLEKSKSRFELLSSATFEGIVLTEEGKILDLNHQLTQIYGYMPGELIDSSLFDLVIPEDRGLLESHIMSGDERPCELRAHHKDGSLLHLEMRVRSITMDNRSMRITAARNITLRKQAEENERKQQELLIHADKMISLGILVSGMAHELNNPNNSIMLNTEVLKESWQSISPILDAYREGNPDFMVNGVMYDEMKLKIPLLYESVLRNAHRIQKIVADLKNYSRQNPLEFKGSMDINSAVESSVSLLSAMIKKSTHHFQLKLDKNLPQIMGNIQNIEQVLINLIQNACQALPDPGKSITLVTRRLEVDNMVEIEVRDRGTGIEEKDLKLVTDPFFTTKRGLGGTGLGLFISSKIIHHHGGTLQLESVPGSGTTARVNLPCIENSTRDTG